MAKKTFKIRARVVFNAQISVQAHDRQEAEAIVKNSFGATIGTVSTSADERITDYEASKHGDTVISRREEKGGEE